MVKGGEGTGDDSIDMATMQFQNRRRNEDGRRQSKNETSDSQMGNGRWSNLLLRDINRERKRAGTVFAVGVVIVAGGIVCSQYHKVFVILIPLGFIPLFGGLIHLGMGIRCPKCRGSLGYGASLSSRLRFCPFCGVCFDSPSGQESKPSDEPNSPSHPR